MPNRPNLDRKLGALLEASSLDDSWMEPFQRECTEPIERLMFALLHDGIKQHLRGAEEACRWIMEPGYGRIPILTFNFICDYFDIDPVGLRKRLCSVGWSSQAFERLQIRSIRGKRRQLKEAAL